MAVFIVVNAKIRPNNYFSGIYDVISYDVTSVLAFKNQGRRNFVVEQNFEWVLQKKKRIISYKITLASYWLISKLTSAKFSNFEKKIMVIWIGIKNKPQRLLTVHSSKIVFFIYFTILKSIIIGSYADESCDMSHMIPPIVGVRD